MDRTSRRSTCLFRVVAALLLMLLCTSAWADPPQVQKLRDALRSGDAETAVALADKATADLPDSTDAWYHAGRAYGWMAMEASLLRKPGWASKAHEAFRRAATLDPGHLGAREGLVQFYLMAPGFLGGGRDKAEAEIADFAPRDPAGGHYLRGLATRDEAVKERELRAAVRLEPSQVRYRNALILVLERGERTGEALAQIQAGLEHAPRDARLLYRFGRHAALQDVQVQAGEAALDRILSGHATAIEEVSLPGAHWRRGQLREKRGERAGALADYRRAIALDSDFDDARKDLARLEASR